MTKFHKISEAEQIPHLEVIDELLTWEKGLVETKFLFGLLLIAMILGASSNCKSNLERRNGMQLDQSTLKDLLTPTFSDLMETLYDVDCVQRILNHYLAMDQETGGGSSPCFSNDKNVLDLPMSDTSHYDWEVD